MCRSMVDIQSTVAEIRREKKKKKEITGQKYNGLPYYIGRPLECGPMPNVMVALPLFNAAKFG